MWQPYTPHIAVLRTVKVGLGLSKLMTSGRLHSSCSEPDFECVIRRAAMISSDSRWSLHMAKTTMTARCVQDGPMGLIIAYQDPSTGLLGAREGLVVRLG